MPSSKHPSAPAIRAPDALLDSGLTVIKCPVGNGIGPSLGHIYGEIEQSLRRELALVSVADVLRQTLQVR
jgi:hypothetical protein